MFLIIAAVVAAAVVLSKNLTSTVKQTSPLGAQPIPTARHPSPLPVKSVPVTTSRLRNIGDIPSVHNAPISVGPGAIPAPVSKLHNMGDVPSSHPIVDHAQPLNTTPSQRTASATVSPVTSSKGTPVRNVGFLSFNDNAGVISSSGTGIEHAAGVVTKR